MAVGTKDFNTLVGDQIRAIQAGANAVLNFATGKTLRAVVEANAGAVGLWLQALVLQVLARARLATSSGADVDSFVADFGLTRLAAVQATGLVSFSRSVTTSQGVVPLGATVVTTDGTETFTVYQDVTNANWNAGLNGYVLAIGVASISVPVRAVNAGNEGNVAAGAIGLLGQGIPFVSAVTNASAFVTGANIETDAALKVRFVVYLQTLSKATKSAIGAAILAVQKGLSYSLTENQTYAGVTQLGYFYVIVDDGTGSPPGSLLTTISNAIDVVRPVTSTFGVYAPVIVTANTILTVTSAAGYSHSSVATAVQAALLAFINAVAVGGTLRYTQLIAVAYGVAGVANVTAVTLNGGTADLTSTVQQVIKSGTITVN